MSDPKDTVKVESDDTVPQRGDSNGSVEIQEEKSTEAEVGTEADRRHEIGGRDGPEPTRYGDWEKNGRCIDF